MTLSTLLRDALRDVTLAWRMLVRRPGFAAVALTTLALGIGAPTAIFSVVNAVLIRPLPFAQADRIVTFRLESQTPAGPFAFDALAVAEALDWSARARTVTSLSVYDDRALTLTTNDGPFRLTGISATPNLFTVLGSAPALGRPFTDADTDRRQVVLSHATWVRYFRANAAIIGAPITLDGEMYRVTGVMAEGFRFPTPEAAFWVPQVIDAGGSRGMALPAVARMTDGVSISDVEREAASFLGDPGDPRITQKLTAHTLQQQLVGGISRVLWVMMAAVSVVSVIATMNIALLLLTRGVTRAREFSIRLALGAGRGRLVRQLSVEGLMLAVFGGLLGVVLATGGLRLLMTLAPASLPRVRDTVIDGRVLLFALAITVLASVVFGVLSAGRVIATDALQRVSGAVTGSALTTTGSRRRQLTALASVELALTMMLLVGAALLLKSFVALALVPQGFEPRGAIGFQVSLPASRYPTGEARLNFLDRLQSGVAHLSGVQHAGLAAELPTRQPTARFAFAAEPSALTGDPMEMPVFETRMIGEGFVEAMGLTLKAGRTFTANDRSGTEPVIVISELLAAHQFGNRNPIGQMLYSRSGNRRVVGVVGDVHPAVEGAESKAAAYLPLRQEGALLDWHSSMQVVVRSTTTASTPALAAPIRALVLSMDRDMPPSNLRALDDDVAMVVAAPRFSATVLGIFAVVALVMAAVGVYGVLSFVAGQRQREIALRMALGATRSSVVRLMMRDGAVIVASGLAIGFIGSVWFARGLTSMLHNVSSIDPMALGVVSALLALLGIAAAYIPARRLARVNVLSALKTD